MGYITVLKIEWFSPGQCGSVGQASPTKWLLFTDHWLKGQWGPITALFSFPRTSHPNPMQFPHLVRYDQGFLVKKTIDHPVNLSIMCTPPPLQFFILFFLCLMLQQDTFPTSTRLSFHLAVTPLGSCLLSFFLCFVFYFSSSSISSFTQTPGIMGAWEFI